MRRDEESPDYALVNPRSQAPSRIKRCAHRDKYLNFETLLDRPPVRTYPWVGHSTYPGRPTSNMTKKQAGQAGLLSIVLLGSLGAAGCGSAPPPPEEKPAEAQDTAAKSDAPKEAAPKQVRPKGK